MIGPRLSGRGWNWRRKNPRLHPGHHQNQLSRERSQCMNDFKAHLKRQIKFIQNSCQLYDQGDLDEAVRLAVTLRVLFHHTKQSTSLLRHLNVKSLQLLSTAAPFVPVPEAPELPELHLAQQYLIVALSPDKDKDVIEYVCKPILGESPRNDHIDFDVWWNSDPIITHKQPATKMTRKDLVLASANQDGGAHVDEKLDPTYKYVRDGSGQQVSFEFRPEWGRPPQTLTCKNVHFASLRQIGYEVLNSPSLLKLAE